MSSGNVNRSDMSWERLFLALRQIQPVAIGVCGCRLKGVLSVGVFDSFRAVKMKTIPALSAELACKECRPCMVFVLAEPVLDLVMGQKGQQIDIE